MNITPEIQEAIELYEKTSFNLPQEWKNDKEISKALTILEKEWEAQTLGNDNVYYIQDSEKAKKALLAYQKAYERLSQESN